MSIPFGAAASPYSLTISFRCTEGKSKDNIVDDQKVSDLLDYIGRLEKAKRKADKRIEELGGIGTVGQVSRFIPPGLCIYFLSLAVFCRS